MLPRKEPKPKAQNPADSASSDHVVEYRCHWGVLDIIMSNPESANTSRSTSPSGGQEPKPRLVSSSLKDRIAKFNNPSAAPLLPTHAFGTAGPGTGTAGAPGKKGLYGNRIPSLDPKSAGHVTLPGRKVSERGGLIGNRIPSSVSGSSVAALAGFAGTSWTSESAGSGAEVPEPKAAPVGLGIGRPPSPTGSAGSSTHSAPAESGSPGTSRSSSPPTSLGGGLPPSLLAATLPDIGGPGAMTPSSTRADAGEEDSDRSAPSTPVVGATIQLPPAEYDLVPGNLKLAAAAQMSRGLSGSSAAALRGFAPSVTSSLASQYDPSSAGNEEKQMMQDVSGISTPTGTPRAAHRDLEGSMRGEGSVVDEGSVVGDGDQQSQRDMDNVTRRLEGLAVQQGGEDDDSERPRSPEGDGVRGDDGMTIEDQPTPSVDVPDPLDDVEIAPPANAKPSHSDSSSGGPIRHGPSDSPLIEDVSAPESAPSNTVESKPQVKPAQEDDDPNKADDLAALKRGDLSRSPAPRNKDPISAGAIDALASTSFRQNLDEKRVPAADKKDQGGHAGTRFLDVDKPDEIIEPSEADASSDAADEEQGRRDGEEHKGEKGQTKTLGPEMIMRPATTRQEGGTLKKEEQEADTVTAKGLRRKHQQRAGDELEIDVKESDDGDAPGGTGDKDHKGMHVPGGIEADLDDPAKNDFVNEAFSGDLEAYTEPDDEAKEGELGTLAPPSHVEYVGPDDVSALEKVGVGQSAIAEAKAANVTSDIADGNNLQHPEADSEQEDAELSKLDKRDGKTYAGELAKVQEEAKAGGHTEDKSVLEPLHFVAADGTPVHPDGDLEKLPTKPKGEDPVRQALDHEQKGAKEELVDLPTSDGSTVQVPKHAEESADRDTADASKTADTAEGSSSPARNRTSAGGGEDESIDLPTSDGSTVQVPRHTDENDGHASDAASGGSRRDTDRDPDAQSATHGHAPIKSADLRTKSENPIPIDPNQLVGKPLQLHIEPAPIAQPQEDTATSSRDADEEIAPTPPGPSRTPAPPDFPETPHNDPSNDNDMNNTPDKPPKSATSTTTQSTSASELDPAIMRAFPDVPDEEHPRVEIHVSPHVTPSKSPVHRRAPPPVSNSTEGGSPSRPKPATDGPRTPGPDQQIGAGGGGLDVVTPGDPADQGATNGLTKKKSTRRYSPKSPLLGDEDPGDFVPGEEGWAIVTKGRDE